MIQKIVIVNAAIIGGMACSNTGTLVIDATEEALLAKHIEALFDIELAQRVTVATIDVAELPENKDKTLILINQRVLSVAKIKVSTLGQHYLIYDAYDLTKSGFLRFRKRIRNILDKQRLLALAQ